VVQDRGKDNDFAEAVASLQRLARTHGKDNSLNKNDPKLLTLVEAVSHHLALAGNGDTNVGLAASDTCASA